MSRPPTIQYTWTIHEVNELVDVLKKAREEDSYALQQDYSNDDGMVPYRVNQARRVLDRRDHIADIIERLSGEHCHDDEATHQKVAAAEVDLAAEAEA